MKRPREITGILPDIPEPRLDRLSEVCYDFAASCGWHDEPRDFLAALMLVVTELAEVAECYRHDDMGMRIDAETGKPLGLDVEMADTLIRIFDLCDEFGIHLDDAFKIKLRFNAGRGWKHGGLKA